jgi:soluble lytic murein transglycosylase-like protein
LVAASLLASLAQCAAASPLYRWTSAIAEASARFGIPEDWIKRVMRGESDGQTVLHGLPITSRAGAMGLMQLMPATWAEMKKRHRLGSDPYDPHDNILAGTAYLRTMYDRFGYPDLFGAYNAGPRRFSEYLVGRRRIPRETADYVAKLNRYERHQMRRRLRLARGANLVAVHRDSDADPSTGADTLGTSLFAVRNRQTQ